MVPVGDTEMRVMLNDTRRKLGSFQVCSLCTCCGGASKSYCLPSPCCYAINCNIPNRPFGFCSFTPKTCNCFGCHIWSFFFFQISIPLKKNYYLHLGFNLLKICNMGRVWNCEVVVVIVKGQLFPGKFFLAWNSKKLSWKQQWQKKSYGELLMVLGLERERGDGGREMEMGLQSLSLSFIFYFCSCGLFKR